MPRRQLVLALLLAVFMTIAAMTIIREAEGPQRAKEVPLPDVVKNAPETLKVYSLAFSRGDFIPTKYTCDGLDVSPPLVVENILSSAKSLLLVVYDPDAPKGTFYHWILYNIPVSTTRIPEDIPKDPVVKGLGLQGRNDFGRIGYGGPCPPSGDRPHRYVFLIIALDVDNLGIEPGAPCRTILEAARGHVVGYGYTYGVYGR
ncbi:hypothetical protein Pyrde_0987 [Pyrodictium delaneyi]|uniref:YbhB/YbcL family Raf kinase inhibitor-like protein n=2 Tax=Pyrodictium delaneyi TaxID=1273541 RepID=A0A0P0N300_9CREN|nr:YbhB/YbcL family Raf kinase inhibitor-like protein [Pyrodictium delaneyi]ALL01035.1 hypothetical protein Pyrde_0987 [Pyrodictium delaneyi]